MTDQMKGVLLTAIGVLFITPDSLLIRLMDGPVLVTVFWRAVFATLVMLTGTFLFYRGRTFAVFRALGWYGLAYAAFMSVGTMLFVSAIQLTAVANTVFIASTAPVFAVFISRIFLGEAISQRMVWTIGLSLVGIAVIASGSIGGHGIGSDTPSIFGDLAALGAAICLAIAFTAARAGRAVSMVPAINGNTGPRYISSAEVSLLLLLEAVLAPILVWAVLGDYPGLASLIGGGLVLCVLAVSNMVKLKAT